MAYFFISDVHGCYDKMINELKKKGFDKNIDTIVNLGDPFDRGKDSARVLKFLMSCPHRILIWGNHDYRLMEVLIQKDKPNEYDVSNGMIETLTSFMNIKASSKMTIEILREKFLGDDIPEYKQTLALLKQYFNECIWAAEWSNLIAVHGWVPVNTSYVAKDNNGHNGYYVYSKKNNWHDANLSEWYDAIWCNTEEMIKNQLFPNKQMIIGHWHAWRLVLAEHEPQRFVEENPGVFGIDCSTFATKRYIAIDGCCNWTKGKVNVYIYEADEKPKYINCLI